MTTANLHQSGVSPAFVRTMAAYNAEMNRRLYAAAGQQVRRDRQADSAREPQARAARAAAA